MNALFLLFAIKNPADLLQFHSDLFQGRIAIASRNRAILPELVKLFKFVCKAEEVCNEARAGPAEEFLLN